MVETMSGKGMVLHDIHKINKKLKFHYHFISFHYAWYPNPTRNVTRCNNHDDLSQLSITLKISIFSEVYI